MNKQDKEKLQRLFDDSVQNWRNRGKEIILDEDIRLDEDNSQFYTTEAEIMVFNLPRDLLPHLHIAWEAYEVFIDIISPCPLSDDMAQLVIKAREICPPVKYFDLLTPFRTVLDEPQWFSWFCKEFLRIPTRASHAFWHKKNFNLEHLVHYEDDGEEGLHFVPKPPPPKFATAKVHILPVEDFDELPF